MHGMLSHAVTKPKNAPPRPRGRPPKVEGGLDHVIYLRATAELASALSEIAAARSAEEERTITAADVAREILERAVKRRGV